MENIDLIIKAIIRNDIPTVNKWLFEGNNVNKLLPNGDTLLSTSACMGDARLQITKLLIESGADVNCLVGKETLLKAIQEPSYCDNEQTIALLRSKSLQKKVIIPSEPQHTSKLSRIELTHVQEIYLAPCPNCGNDKNQEIHRVNYTWWGGSIGPRLLNQVKCFKCGKTYNGKTGKSNDMVILIYLLIMVIMIVILLMILLRPG